jgi:hypothetical protein
MPRVDKMKHFVVLLLLNVFYDNVIEFGLKLKNDEGNSDFLLLGLVVLLSTDDEVKFKDFIDRSVQDYLINELRLETRKDLPLNILEGTIISSKSFVPSEFRHELTGDMLSLKYYINIMANVYYRHKMMLITFYEYPILRSNQYRVDVQKGSKILELYDCPFAEQYKQFFISAEVLNNLSDPIKWEDIY